MVVTLVMVVISLVTKMMVVIRLLTNIMVDIMVTKMMLVEETNILGKMLSNTSQDLNIKGKTDK